MFASLAFLTMALFPSAAPDDPAKQELAAIQGGWKLESLEVDGSPSDLMETSFWWFIKCEKVLYGGSELAGLTLDPTTSPKCIDLAFREPKRVFEGIYTIEEDVLKICVSQVTEGVRERPQDFATKGKPGRRLLVFKRDKDRKADSLEGLAAFVGVQIKTDDQTKQVLVVTAIAGSPAEKAGLKKDDAILKVGDQDAGDLRSTVNMIRKVKPGSELTLRIKRDGKEKDVTIKAGVVPFYLLD